MMPLIRTILLIAFTTIATGCLSTPSDNFADSLDQIRATPTIDVYLDSFILSDIKGKALGYNVENNRLVATELINTLVAQMKKKGYKANIVFIGSGFQFDLTENAEVYYSEKWKSTGSKFPGTAVIEGEQYSPTDTMNDYIRTALIDGKSTNSFIPPLFIGSASQKKELARDLGLLPEQKTERTAVLNNPPAELLNGGSDLKFFIKHADLDISAAKQLAVGAASLAASIAISGGTSASLMTFSTKGPIESVLMDMRDKKVVWAANLPDTARYVTWEKSIPIMLHHLPKR